MHILEQSVPDNPKTSFMYFKESVWTDVWCVCPHACTARCMRTGIVYEGSHTFCQWFGSPRMVKGPILLCFWSAYPADLHRQQSEADWKFGRSLWLLQHKGKNNKSLTGGNTTAAMWCPTSRGQSRICEKNLSCCFRKKEMHSACLLHAAQGRTAYFDE